MEEPLFIATCKTGDFSSHTQLQIWAGLKRAEAKVKGCTRFEEKMDRDGTVTLKGWP